MTPAWGASARRRPRVFVPPEGTTPPAGAPTITSLSRTSGPLGVMVTVTGTGFAATDTWAVGGVTAQAFEVASATTARVVVPIGAPSGAVTCTNASGTATGATFTVTEDRYRPRVWMPRMCHYNDATRLVELLPGYAASIAYATHLPPSEVVLGNAGSRAANQSALNAAITAACNGTGPRRIRLTRGVDYGTRLLDVAPPEGQWVYIESDSVKTSELRAEGSRVGADDAALMAKCYLDTYNTPAFELGPNARRFRFVGLEMAILPSALTSIRTTNGRNSPTPFSFLGFVAYDVAPTGSSRRTGTPADIIIDRCRLVSDIEVGMVRAVLGNIDRLTIRDSELLNLAWATSDAQAISVTSCGGRHVVQNCTMTCALGEHILVGGARTWAAEFVPSDLFYDGNLYDFPVAWDALAGGAGLGHKAMLEVKHGRRIVDQRAIHRNYPAKYGQDNIFNVQCGDQGTPTGLAPYARTEDIIIRFTDARDSTRWATFNCYGTAPNDPDIKAARRVDFRHNRHLQTTKAAGGGILVDQARASLGAVPGDPEARALTDLWIEDNTAVASSPPATGYPSSIYYAQNAEAAIRHTIRDNVLLIVGGEGTSDWQLARDGQGPLAGSWTGMTKVDCVAAGNLIAPASSGGAAAISSTAVATVAGALVNSNGSLQGGSPGIAIARDGGPAGADIALLESLITNVLTGR